MPPFNGKAETNIMRVSVGPPFSNHLQKKAYGRASAPDTIQMFNARIAVTIENTHFEPHEQCIAQLDAHLQFFILNYSGYKGI